MSIKNLNKLFIGATALALLTGCGAQKVSREKFQEAVNKLEEHTYTEAVVKYDIDATGTGAYGIGNK